MFQTSLLRWPLLLIGIFHTLHKGETFISVSDTGEMLSSQELQLTVESQFILQRYSGMNLNIILDSGLTPSSSIRGFLSLGEVDLSVGAFYKLIPFPDTARQPAIGAQAGFVVTRIKNTTIVSVRIHPLLSKKFISEFGDLIAYGAIPTGFTITNGDLTLPISIAIGGEFRPMNLTSVSFRSELGANVRKSMGYITLGGSYRF